jgi:hypothetical protein
MNQEKRRGKPHRKRIAIFAVLIMATAFITGVFSWTFDGVGAYSRSDVETGESSPFRLVGTQPQANALDISPISVISATFDENIDVTSVSTATFIVRGVLSGIYSGIFTVTESTVEFRASSGFKAGELIVTTVTTGVQSVGGMSLESPHTWEFSSSVGHETGLGQGIFDERQLSFYPGHYEDVALGDLDNDGDLDAYEIVNFDSEGIVWMNDGIGNFVDSGQRLGHWSVDIALGDLDGDGDIDAFVANDSRESSKVFINDGDGLFTSSGQDFGDVDSRGVALGDLDSDGDLDAFITVRNSGETVWLNGGRGVFTDTGQSLGDVYSSHEISLGDVDADGDLDAAVITANSSEPNKLWLNDGDGFFHDSGEVLGVEAREIKLGDLDNDGDLDAILLDSEDIGVWINDGNGVFTSSGQGFGGDVLVLGDLDGDGDLDVIVGHTSPYNDKTFLNDGTGSFIDSGEASSRPSGAIAIGDLDSDGDIDVFSAKGAQYANYVYINRNQLANHIFLPHIHDSICRDYFDDFSDNTSGWPQINDPYVMAGYWNDMYLVHSKQAGYIYLFEAPHCHHQQYMVEVKARWSESNLEGSSYGLIFGITGDYESYYLFDLNPRWRQFRLLRRDPSGWSVVVPITGSSAINDTTSWNTLSAYLFGHSIGLEINGQTLGVWSIPEIKFATGSGIASAPYSNYPQSRAWFDDFKIINIQNSSVNQCSSSDNPGQRSVYSQDIQPVDLGIPSWQDLAMDGDKTEE